MTAQSSVNIAFKDFSKINENINKKIPTIPDKQIQDKDSQKIDATKLMIGATVLATTIALGIYVAKRGRFKNEKIDIVQNNKPISQTTQTTQTAQTSHQSIDIKQKNEDATASVENTINNITENEIKKTEVPSEKIITETQTQPKTDINPQKISNSESKDLPKQISETTPSATTISKLQLSKEDSEIKNNLEKFLGCEFSEELYLKIKPEMLNKGKDEYFNNTYYFRSQDIQLYLSDTTGCYRSKINSLFEDIEYTIKWKIKPNNVLEDETLKTILFNIESKKSYVMKLNKWNILHYLQNLYEKNPNVNFKNKERFINAYNEMANSWLYRIRDKKLSSEVKNKIMQELLGFQQGIGHYSKPEEITDADYISAILSAARSKMGKNADITSSQYLNEIALDLAKKISPSYEDATRLAIENNNHTVDLLKRRGDKYLPLKQTELYDEETQDFIINEYIDCELGGAYKINYALRNEGFNKTDEYTKSVIKGLDELIEESDKLDNDYVVFRALGFSADSDKWEQWKKIGSIITDKGFVSTTPTNGTYLRMFGGRPGKNYILRIKLPKGTQGINMRKLDYLQNEKNEEYLLPRNSSFRVLGVDESTKVIDLEYLLPS